MEFNYVKSDREKIFFLVLTFNSCIFFLIKKRKYRKGRAKRTVV